ncbi:Nse4 C-terminal-domain-containing protein [Scenedesmus sp. NREL 46B-D3]|nr:Nse4 C-terminal-domain-containing protein [Scenedesmus sp. NREL 46B-D3]
MGAGGAAPFREHQQSVSERRVLRAEYRSLHSATIAGKENLILNGGDELRVKLTQLEDLHKKVARPREHAVDAEVFAQLTECSLNMIKRGQAANKGRTPADLIRALRQRFIADPLMVAGLPSLAAFDWAALGAEASLIHRTAPGISCMLGPLSAEAKARKAIVRQAKRSAAEAVVHPDELQDIHEEEKQETDRNMENMWRQLKRLAPGTHVRVTHLVCNHSSFAQTVENIFTLSFLVRDQHVRLLADAEAGLLVQPVSEAEKHAAQQQGVKAQQFMMSLSMQDWDIMKQLVPRTASMMPHRPGPGTPSPAAGGSTRAGQRGANKRARTSR